MKIKCSLLLVSAGVLLVTTSGCRSIRMETSNSLTPIGNLPPNTVAIHNTTQYSIRVSRNHVPWEQWEHREHTNAAYRSPTFVQPHQTLVLHDCTPLQQERITVGLTALKSIRMGCLIGKTTLVRQHVRIEVGTTNPPILVTVRGRGY